MIKRWDDETVNFRLGLRSFFARRNLLVVVQIGAAFLFIATESLADDWLGVQSTDWFVGPNWSDATVPTSGDDVAIQTITPNPTSISSGLAEASSLQVGGQLDFITGVASTGTGSLSITGGGQLINGAGNFFDSLIGVGTGSLGAVTLTGIGSSWTSTGAVLVGSSGATGSLSLQSGSTADVAALFAGSNIADFAGFPVINGSGPSTGTVSVLGGSQLTSTFFADVGVGGGAQGTMTISGPGSTVTSDGSFIGGALGGRGTLNVLDGGTLLTGPNGPFPFSVIGGGGPSNMGSGPPINGGIGFATVSGPGSSWINGGGLYIGGFVDGATGTFYPGTGSLTILDGGRVTGAGDAVSGLPDAVGLGAGAVGSVVISDNGSRWDTGQNFVVGFAGGSGTMDVVNGGTLEVAGILGVGIGIGGFSGGGGNLSVRNGGTVIVNDGGPVGFAGAVVGGGGVAGSVAISGTGSSLIVNGGLFVGGQTDLMLGPGVGTVTLAYGGLLQANEINLAPEPGSQGTLNIGAGPGQTAASPGLLATSSVIFGNGNGVLNFNHTGAYTFSPVLIGTGTLNQHAGTTLLTADSSGFGGSTTVVGGELIVGLDSAAQLGGTVAVQGSGTLGGSGSVGPTAVLDGGTIAPGNSIGTLSIAGNVTFAPGSAYQLEIEPSGASDLISASGTATIGGGTVSVVNPSGSYELGTSYTILTAAGGVVGAFDSVQRPAPLPFIDLVLAYDPNAVYLNLSRSEATFCSVAVTKNQCAAANGSESLGVGNAVYDAIVNLADGQIAQGAFDSLSGEIYASVQSVLINDSYYVRDAAMRRLQAVFEGAAPSSTPLLAYASDGPTSDLQPPDRASFWANGLGSWSNFDTDANAASVDQDLGGILLGADIPLAETWRLGVLTGYSRDDFRVNDRSSSGTSDNFHLGIYGGREWNSWAFRTGLAYSWHDIETQRSINFPGFADRAEADYNAGTAQAFGELGYRFNRGSTEIEPFAGLAYANLNTDSLNEDGGAAALTSAGQSTDVTFTTLGVRAAVPVTLGQASARLRGLLGWQHAFGDVVSEATNAFLDGDSFTVAGIPLAKDEAIVQAGLEFDLTDKCKLELSYSGRFASNAQEQLARAGLRANF